MCDYFIIIISLYICFYLGYIDYYHFILMTLKTIVKLSGIATLMAKK